MPGHGKIGYPQKWFFAREAQAKLSHGKELSFSGAQHLPVVQDDKNLIFYTSFL
jgi:hypothetical protein